MAKPNEKKKFNNVTITAFVGNDKFGEGSSLSVPIDAKAYDALQGLQIGQKLLMKRSTKQAKNGADLYFLEIPDFSNSPNNDI